MKFFRLFLVILFICLCASKLSAGKIYVWTDESGQEHFSNVSPPDKKLQNLEIRETDNHRTKSKPTKSSQQQSDQVARRVHYLYDEGCKMLKRAHNNILSRKDITEADYDDIKKSSSSFKKFTDHFHNARIRKVGDDKMTDPNSIRILALEGMAKALLGLGKIYEKEHKFRETKLSFMKAGYCSAFMMKIMCDDTIEQLNLNIPINHSWSPPWEDEAFQEK